MVENPDAVDPMEVIYRLVQISGDGLIDRRDGFIYGCEHGWREKLREALTQPLLVLEQPKPRTERARAYK